MHWFIDPIKNQYADFSGRTGRKAFWMFVLFSFLMQFAVGMIEGILGIMFIGTLFSLVILVPAVAITARRLHDINKSGWWQLIAFIPFVGTIILVVWCATKSDMGSNNYGSGADTMEMTDTPQGEVGTTAMNGSAETMPEVDSNGSLTEENKQEGY